MASQHTLVVLFDVIVIVATVLSLCTFLPAIFSKYVHRSIGWYSLMTAWLVYSLSYALLIGKQEGPDPPFGLCVFQTLLVYAVPALVSTGMMCYYFEFYTIVHGLRSGNPRPYSTWRTFWLVITPWLMFLAIILEVLLLIFPGKRLDRVERAGNNFYCHLGDNIPSLVTAGTVLANMIILLPLEFWTGYIMYRNWDVFRRLTRTDRQIFLAVYLRLFFCTIAAVIAFAFSTLDFVFPAPDATSLVYPTLPIFMAFAFGTQKDLMKAWLFWRPQRSYGSIVFHSSGGAALTTNIYTSWGAVTASEATTTVSEAQSQLQKPAVVAENSPELTLGAAAVVTETLDPEGPFPPSPGMTEKPSTDQPQSAASHHAVHFELPTKSPTKSQNQPSILQRQSEGNATQTHPHDELTIVPRPSPADS